LFLDEREERFRFAEGARSGAENAKDAARLDVVDRLANS
jgi:hypothetical protein